VSRLSRRRSSSCQEHHTDRQTQIAKAGNKVLLTRVSDDSHAISYLNTHHRGSKHRRCKPDETQAHLHSTRHAQITFTLLEYFSLDSLSLQDCEQF
jgi:hypothetical protein